TVGLTRLAETINATVEAGGNVLVPVDAALRILELAYLLDQHWFVHKIKTPLLLLGHTSYYAIQYAKSMTEWMGGNAAKQFHQSREHPFDFRAIRLVHNKDELDKLAGPKVVLATCASMTTGYSRELWLEWAQQPTNTVILTERGDPHSIARQLHDTWIAHYASVKANTVHPATPLDLAVKTKIPLEGEELRLYLEEERAQKEREAHEAAVIARSRNVLDEGGIASDSSGSEDEDEGEDGEGEGDAMDTDIEHRTTTDGHHHHHHHHRSTRDAERHQAMLDTEHDLYVRDGVRSGGFFKQTQSFPMFPFTERRRRFDDYGETIQQDHYMQDIEKLEQDAGRVPQGQPNFGAAGGAVAMAEKKAEPPCKYLVEMRTVHVQCQVQFIDFEGLADGRSIKTILAQVAPRKLIVVHGTKEATEDLARTCLATERMTHDVFAPSIGETLNVSAATNMYQAIPMEQQRQYTRSATLIGDAKLTELKRALQQQPGMQAEFRGEGVLTATGQLVLEGAFSSDYFKLRRLLYDQLAIV
ncbi:beta-lactamase-like protein, partial [Syncephalis pseudoplumigaleata]